MGTFGYLGGQGGGGCGGLKWVWVGDAVATKAAVPQRATRGADMR